MTENFSISTTILENISASIYVRDLDMNILYINPAAERLSGWSQEEAKKHKCYEIFGGKTEKCQNVCPMEKVIHENIPLIHHERELNTRNGQLKKMRVSISPLMQNGQIQGGIATMEDISNFKELEETQYKTLKENLLNYSQAILKNSSLKETADVLYQQCRDLIGCRSAFMTLLGESFMFDMKNEDLLRQLKSPWAKALHNKEIVIENILPPGPFDLNNILIIPILEKEEILGTIVLANKPDGFTSQDTVIAQAFCDLSHMSLRYLQSNQHLKESKDRLQLALKFSTDGLFDWNLENNQIYYSPGWKKMLGYEDWELKNDLATWEMLTPLDDVRKAFKMMEDLVNKRRKDFQVEIKMRHKEGHWVDILARANVLFNKEGKAYRAIGTHANISNQKGYEEEILHQKEKIERYLNLANIIFISLDLKGNILFANQHARELLEWGDKPLTGVNWFNSFLPEDEKESVRKIFNEISNGSMEKVEYAENTILTAKRNKRLIGWHNSFIKDTQGRINGIISAGNDITEHRYQEERYQSIIQTSMDGFIRSDVKGIILEVNQAYCEMSGYSRQELLGKSIQELEDKEKASEIMEHLQYVIRNDGDRFESRHRKKDGSQIFVEVVIQYRTKDQGQFVSFIKDITERKKQEQKLEFQAMLLEQIQDHIIATDLDGNIIFVNDAECRSLGRSREELLNSTIEVLGSNSEKGATQSEILSHTLENGEWHGEVVNYNSQGKEIIFETRTQLVSDASGEANSLVGISTDITEKKEITRQLQQAQKMESIGSLAGGVAHDFNNILTPIIGLTDLMMQEYDSDQPIYKRLEQIREAGERGAEVVNQILSFSRKSNHTLKAIKLQSVVEEILKLIRATIPKHIRITETLYSTAPVLADAIQIHQVFMNIMTNAIHATKDKHGKIHINLNEEELDPVFAKQYSLLPKKYVCLAISDNGMGIPEDVINKIFEPYFTTKGIGKGTGLGLAVVYGIIKDHHGAISVESEVGKGTSFKIYLPPIAPK